MRSVRTYLLCLICLAGLQATTVGAEDDQLIIPQTVGSNVAYTSGDRPQNLSPEETIQVYVGPEHACCGGKSPIAGRYDVSGRSVQFAPAFEFLEGQAYTIKTWRGDLTEFEIAPHVERALAEVRAIYPSGPSIPENTLRFYIQFSAPMMPHMAEEFIDLVDANGVADDEAFMSFKQELWNADRTRLTLLMDPGRIKRGVAQNRSLGPALLEEQSYAIVVREGWPSANGRSGAPRFERNFTVSSPLRDIPTIDSWAVSAPRLGSRDAVEIRFDRPFDRFQTAKSIAVLDAAGDPVVGEASLENDQRLWRFLPRAPWTAEDIELRIDARLEDVAGNNFRDTLDHAKGVATRDIDDIVLPISLRAEQD